MSLHARSLSETMILDRVVGSKKPLTDAERNCILQRLLRQMEDGE